MTDHAPHNDNVDTAEIAKFSALAHRWWDLDGEFAPLHRINPLRLSWIESFVPLQNRHIVDVGCGGGILADSMARRGAASVLGIDLATKSLRVAQMHALEAQTPNISYQTISAEALAAAKPAQFDVVTCMEMLEHVPDPASVVQACADMAKPGGWVFFSTLNRTASAFFKAIVGAEYVLGLLPRGTHEYAKFIPPEQLSSFCRQSGLTVTAMRGLSFNPVTGQYATTSDVSVNYMLATCKT